MKCECGCGKETSVYYGKRRRFISGHNGRGKRKEYLKHTCKCCDKIFETMPHMKNRSFCSTDCRNLFRSEAVGDKNPRFKRVAHICGVCGEEFYVIPSRLTRGVDVYCSQDCGREGRKRKISGVKRARKNPVGKVAAKRRDRFKCLICGFDSVVAAHHIVPVKDGGSNEISNIITLCPNHHYMAHAGLLNSDDLLLLVPKFEKPTNLLSPILPMSGKNTVSFRGRVA